MKQFIYECEDIIKNILSKLPILYTEQLVIALKNTFENMSSEEAMRILKILQKHGYVLLSQSGWAMTKGVYQTLTSDKFYDGIEMNSDIRIPEKLTIFGNKKVADEHGLPKETWTALGTSSIEELVPKAYLELLDCFWIVADMMPLSENFFLGKSPWHIIFEKENEETGQVILYEITRIPDKKARIRTEALKNIPHVDNKDLQANIRRIAILDSDKNIDLVPHIGFTHICVLNSESPTHYKVKEKRLENAWDNGN